MKLEEIADLAVAASKTAPVQPGGDRLFLDENLALWHRVSGELLISVRQPASTRWPDQWIPVFQIDQTGSLSYLNLQQALADGQCWTEYLAAISARQQRLHFGSIRFQSVLTLQMIHCITQAIADELRLTLLTVTALPVLNEAYTTLVQTPNAQATAHSIQAHLHLLLSPGQADPAVIQALAEEWLHGHSTQLFHPEEVIPLVYKPS